METTTDTPALPSESDYQDRKAELVELLIVWLQTGDALGKSQQAMAADFMGAFGQAANQLQQAANGA